jgi:hypothetical protein
MGAKGQIQEDAGKEGGKLVRAVYRKEKREMTFRFNAVHSRVDVGRKDGFTVAHQFRLAVAADVVRQH